MNQRTATPAAAHAPVPAAAKSPPANRPTPQRPRDAHTGHGGSYVRDPATGLRTRVADEPTQTQTGSGPQTLP